MKSIDYQIQKSNQIELLNKLVQSTRINSFSKYTKEIVLEKSTEAIRLIQKQKIEVYKQLDKHDLKLEDFDFNSYIMSTKGIKAKNRDSINEIKSFLGIDIANMIHEVNRTSTQNISSEAFQVFQKSQDFINNERKITDIFIEISKIIVENKEEEQKIEQTESKKNNWF